MPDTNMDRAPDRWPSQHLWRTEEGVTKCRICGVEDAGDRSQLAEEEQWEAEWEVARELEHD